jgi:hypothetical protein
LEQIDDFVERTSLAGRAIPNRAIEKNYDRFSEALGGETIRVLETARHLMSEALAGRGLDSLTNFRNEVGALIPDEDSSDILIPGYSYTMGAVLHCIWCLQGEATRWHAERAVSGAYQALTDAEMDAAMIRAGGWVGSESDEYEHSSTGCQEEIAFQLEQLSKLSNQR